MSRIPKHNDFTVPIDGVGTFTFGRRTMKDEIAYQVAYARIIDGVKPTHWLEIVGTALADLQVMTVRAPEGWDLDEMDPTDDETYGKLLRVHRGFRDKEASFRRGSAPQREGTGAGAGGNDPVPVPPEVQPAAHG